MARKASEQPTPVEAQILRVLWTRGEATLRDVCDDLSAERPVTPSGISTMLKIMVDKGLAKVVDERRPQKFAAAVSKQETRGSVLTDIARKFFGGSLGAVVKAALGDAKDLSDSELDEIERMIAARKPTGDKPAVDAAASQPADPKQDKPD